MHELDLSEGGLHSVSFTEPGREEKKQAFNLRIHEMNKETKRQNIRHQHEEKQKQAEFENSHKHEQWIMRLRDILTGKVLRTFQDLSENDKLIII